MTMVFLPQTCRWSLYLLIVCVLSTFENIFYKMPRVMLTHGQSFLNGHMLSQIEAMNC